MEIDYAGYLIETLDPLSRQQVEDALRTDPDAPARMARVERVLAPLAEDAEQPEPPPSLTLMTLARIAEYKCALPCAPRVPSCSLAPPRGSFRRADLLVAALLMLLVSGLLAPYLVQQWRGSNRMACANNLRKFWTGLDAYARIHEGAFPRVEPEGTRAVAGIFVPILGEAGLLGDVSVECPAQGRREPARLTVADLDHLRREQPDAFATAARQLSGHYAYTIGYDEGHSLVGLTQQSGDGLPIMADRASSGGLNSTNHTGSGQNVLYVGGNVRWGTLPKMGIGGDHIFLNQHERREAGVCRTDTVLAPSHARPYQTID